MYIRGGYNVYPAEVEGVLGEVAGVRAVAVVGVPDPVLGEIGAAFIVSVPGQPPPGLEELRAAVRRKLADYKAPDRLHVLGELPVTALGKIDKRALAAHGARGETSERDADGGVNTTPGDDAGTPFDTVEVSR
jgi:acyl-CoA synthetase (AMP-forming)/AMP-acid ligase II